MHGRPAPGIALPLLVMLAGCARPTLSPASDDSTDSGDPPSSSGTSSSSTSTGGGSSGGSSGTGSSGGSSTSSSSGEPDTGWTSTDWTDTDEGVFIQVPDGAGSDIECDIWSQDCPPGQKCMPWANDGGSSWNATKCSPIDPNPKEIGEECTVEGNGVSGVDDCKAGAMCWDVNPETNTGYCVAFCIGSPNAPDCENPCEHCTMYGDGVLILCLPGCDPLAQDCPSGDVCVPYPGDDGFVCVLDASGEEGQHKDPCEYVNVCDPGLACVNAEVVPGCVGSVGCCAPFCNAAVPDPGCPDTDQGVECVPWFEEGQPPPLCVDGEVGICVLP